MASRTPQPDPEDVRKDLLATLAASRELGPEMDAALADSYMEKYHQQPQPRAEQGIVPHQSGGQADLITGLGLVVGLAAYIAILVATGGHLWWMFWPVMGWMGWRWRRWSYGGADYEAQRTEMRMRRRQLRDEMRLRRQAMRMGYPYLYDDRQPPLSAPRTPPAANPPVGQEPSSGQRPAE
jgi:hypothetical protein